MKRYDDYTLKMQKIADVRNAAALLNWDEETYLPEKGAAFRGRQLATLSTLAHELFVEESLGKLLQDLAGDHSLDAVQKGNVTKTLEDYEKNKKYTSDFVHRLSATTSKTYHAWIQARKENDFDCYEPALEEMIALKRQEAELLGYETHPYDALLDDYEKGATVKMLDDIFKNVVIELKPFADKILAQPPVDDSLLHQHFDQDKQWQYGLRLLEAMGFDFKAGRQDISEHPFTTSFNAQDVRVTTRIDENDFANMAWSCIHEGGHALYEQGLPIGQYGLPAGEAASLSIHESQSRLWENNVGRSMNFWKYHYKELKNTFPEQLAAKSIDHFYHAINKVQPSLIRTESDEITYHFHILIRYEIEKQLIAGDLSTKDLREAWNTLYKKHLNMDVPDDRQGVLQDIHWSHGSFGYFPTYTLGSFYAAQFYKTAQHQLMDLDDQIASGQLSGLLGWLRENIHRHGSLYRSEALCHKVTGEHLNFKYFMAYVKEKYGGIYEIG